MKKAKPNNDKANLSQEDQSSEQMQDKLTTMIERLATYEVIIQILYKFNDTIKFKLSEILKTWPSIDADKLIPIPDEFSRKIQDISSDVRKKFPHTAQSSDEDKIDLIAKRITSRLIDIENITQIIGEKFHCANIQYSILPEFFFRGFF